MKEEKLKKGGWTLSSISGGQHLERIMGMFKELNFEIELEELKPEECGECNLCYRETNETAYKIYTRPKIS